MLAHVPSASASAYVVRLCESMSLKITNKNSGMGVSKKTWREIHEERKKRREEKFLKRAMKAEKQKEVDEKPAEEESNVVRTLSIAVPGSILANAQSPELRAYLAGQVARSACIYKINEIVIFDDEGDTPPSVIETDKLPANRRFCVQFARLLQYLECPQYLRKKFFPLHYDLQYAGLMNPLDAPHHLRQDEYFPFREGVTTDKPVKKGKGTHVDVGLLNEVVVKESIKPGFRVTVELKNGKSKRISGDVVPPDTPMKQLNTYWGYSVRIAASLSEVFSKSPYPKGYDMTIGTSEKGTNIDDVKKKQLRDFTHAIIVFGGLAGLESALENDTLEVDDVSLLFDHYINTCPQQGSRTIRTEEAILITLAELRRKMFGSS